jgi:hypothetical protein
LRVGMTVAMRVEAKASRWVGPKVEKMVVWRAAKKADEKAR